MPTRARRWLGAARRLERRDARFAVRAVALGAALPVLLRTVSLPRLVDWMAAEPSDARRLPDARRMVRITDAILARGHGVWSANCAVRSLILLRYLGRRGEPVAVYFGVRRGESPDVLDGHAWVCIDDEPLAEAEDPRPLYKVTFRFPKGASR